jgi:hypothetical protein
LENRKAATLQADYVKENIHKDLLDVYGTDSINMKKDMDSISIGSTSTFLQIVNNDIKGKYINKNSDSNDMFVIGKWIKSNVNGIPEGAIIADPSFDCSKNGQIRTLDIEIAGQYNKELAKNGLVNIINQNTNDPIVWEYLTPTNPNHKMITTQGLTGIKSIFMDEGIDGLATYEVINPSYLLSDKDIFLTNDIDLTGNKVDNYKIIVVQGFNIYDAITTNHYQLIEDYQYKLKTLTNNYTHEMQMLIFEGISICAIVFIAFFSVCKLQNILIDKQV